MEIKKSENITPIKRVLIANRGEIVSRIAKTCKNLNIETVIIFSPEDSAYPYLNDADYSHLLQGNTLEETYLNQDAIIDIAKQYKADAIHPGYGFLSENADFAQACINNDLIWIGPAPSIMRRMADKTEARKLAQNINIPTIPAFSGDKSKLKESITEKDYPILLKAAAGGGGRGMRIVESSEDLNRQIELASNEAMLAFGDDRLFIEKYLDKAKHIEVQVVGDNHGHYIHLFERECSIQRRYQKVVEESPSSSISNDIRDKLTGDALKLVKAAGYNNAGTVEFMVGPQADYYFIEVNARIQVEHPVTEMITGIDLVEQQIRVAENRQLSLQQHNITSTGYAIECRICAEDYENNFLPSPGKISGFVIPSTKESRTDTALYDGAIISTSYDSMIVKQLIHHQTRQDAINGMIKLLKETAIFGINTNIPFLISILKNKDFQQGQHFTTFISQYHESISKDLINERSNGLTDLAIGGSAVIEFLNCDNNVPQRSGNPWRDSGYWRAISEFNQRIDDKEHSCEILNLNQSSIKIAHNNQHIIIDNIKKTEKKITLSIDQENKTIHWMRTLRGTEISIEGSNFIISNPITDRTLKQKDNTDPENSLREILSPLPGKLVKLFVKPGDKIKEGKPLAVIESMKIENQIVSESNGVVVGIHCEESDQISHKQKLMIIKPQ